MKTILLTSAGMDVKEEILKILPKLRIHKMSFLAKKLKIKWLLKFKS